MNTFVEDIVWEIEQINSAIIYYEKAIKSTSNPEQANKYRKQINRLNKEIKNLEKTITTNQ